MARLQSLRRHAGHGPRVRDHLHPASRTPPNEGVAEVNTRIKGIIEGMGGKILKVDNWGKRRLAYEVAQGAQGHLPVLAVPGAARRRRGDRAQPAHARQRDPLPDRQGRRGHRRRGAPERDRRDVVREGGADRRRRGGDVPVARRRRVVGDDDDDGTTTTIDSERRAVAEPAQRRPTTPPRPSRRRPRSKE